MPVVVQAQAEKTEHQERLWCAIKRHVLQERKRKKEGNTNMANSHYNNPSYFD